VSLPPLLSCVSNPPCAKDCYANKAYKWYAITTVKPAWDENLAYYRSDPSGYFREIAEFIAYKKPPRFRWHVGGDIPDVAYFTSMRNIAWQFPATIFLVYTRRPFAWQDSELPNLTVLRSLWIDEEPPEMSAGPFFKVLAKDQEVPTNGILCPGSCKTCDRCWVLMPSEITYIYKH
jgi:hypothetical protein